MARMILTPIVTRNCFGYQSTMKSIDLSIAEPRAIDRFYMAVWESIRTLESMHGEKREKGDLATVADFQATIETSREVLRLLDAHYDTAPWFRLYLHPYQRRKHQINLLHVADCPHRGDQISWHYSGVTLTQETIAPIRSVSCGCVLKGIEK